MRLCHVLISQKSALALVSARSQTFWKLTPVLTIATHLWKCWSRLPQRGSPSQFLMSRSLDSVVAKPRHTDLLRKLDDSAKARRVVAERGKAIQERAIIRIRDGRRARKDPTQRTVVLSASVATTRGGARSPDCIFGYWAAKKQYSTLEAAPISPCGKIHYRFRWERF